MELSNPQHEALAQHVVAGLSLTQAAIRAGYKPTAAANMGSRVVKLPTVAMRIRELQDFKSSNQLTAAGLRTPLGRVSAMESRWHRMRQVIDERALDPDMQSVPGGKTGLLCMTFKQLGSGKEASVVREYKVDTGLLTALLEHERQAAEELGQWTTRKETFSQNVSLKLMRPAELQEVLKQHLGTIPVAERQRLIESEPELASVLATPSECVGSEAETEPEA